MTVDAPVTGVSNKINYIQYILKISRMKKKFCRVLDLILFS